MLLIDIEKGRIISDEEIKAEIATRHPYKQWLANTQLILEDLSPVEPRALRKRRHAARSPAGVRLHARKTPSS